jgi:hypothetical protein
MSFFSKIRGTISTLFQLGEQGPQLKNDSGAVGARNPADSAYVNARGADPQIADDLVTKRYGDANYGGGGSVNQGTATCSFGSTWTNGPVSVAITGQTAILSTSIVEAWLALVATSDHSEDEVKILAPELGVVAGDIVPGTGFTVYMTCTQEPMYGAFTVNWRWS